MWFWASPARWPPFELPLCSPASRAQSHAVRVVATEPALYFFDPGELASASGDNAVVAERQPGPLYRDRDEWPGGRYRRGDPVLHIEFRNWADLLVVAPLDANTLAKFALGLCDNFLTCLFRAWDFSKPVILAPAMNTLMWQNPVTARHLGQLLLDHGDPLAAERLEPGLGPRPLRQARPQPDPDPPPVQAPGLRRCRPRRHGRSRDDRRGGADLVRRRSAGRSRARIRGMNEQDLSTNLTTVYTFGDSIHGHFLSGDPSGSRRSSSPACVGLPRFGGAFSRQSNR